MQSTGADFKGAILLITSPIWSKAESTRRKPNAPAVSSQIGLFI